MRKYILMLLILAGIGRCRAMGMGSAKELKGNVYVLSIFISDGDWSKQERYDLLQKQYEAEEWLKKYAAEYGSNVTFHHGNYGYETPVYVKNLPTGYGSGEKVSVDVVYEVMTSIGWNKPADFSDWAQTNAGCSQALVLVYCNATGKSYSMRYNDSYSDKYFLEGAVMFKGYNKDQKLYPASIAHEILHLFGAIDLYEVTEADRGRAELAAAEYADDIMRRNPYYINDAAMGAFTAWRVGIAPYKPEFAGYSKK